MIAVARRQEAHLARADEPARGHRHDLADQPLQVRENVSLFMTSPWQLFLTWGVMVGIGAGAGAVGFAGTVANRWFLKRTGFAAGTTQRC